MNLLEGAPEEEYQYRSHQLSGSPRSLYYGLGHRHPLPWSRETGELCISFVNGKYNECWVRTNSD